MMDRFLWMWSVVSKIDIATCSLHDVYVSTVRTAYSLFSDRFKHSSTSFQVFTKQHFGGERSWRVKAEGI
jgi:hypothetical protein